MLTFDSWQPSTCVYSKAQTSAQLISPTSDLTWNIYVSLWTAFYALSAVADSWRHLPCILIFRQCASFRLSAIHLLIGRNTNSAPLKSTINLFLVLRFVSDEFVHINEKKTPQFQLCNYIWHQKLKMTNLLKTRECPISCLWSADNVSPVCNRFRVVQGNSIWPLKRHPPAAKISIEGHGRLQLLAVNGLLTLYPSKEYRVIHDF